MFYTLIKHYLQFDTKWRNYNKSSCTLWYTTNCNAMSLVVYMWSHSQREVEQCSRVQITLYTLLLNVTNVKAGS